MPNFCIQNAQRVQTFIVFQPDIFAIDPKKCFRFQLFDRNGTPLHHGNDLSGLSDEDLIASYESLRSVLYNILSPELNKRVAFCEMVHKEIEKLEAQQLQTQPGGGTDGPKNA